MIFYVNFTDGDDGEVFFAFNVPQMNEDAYWELSEDFDKVVDMLEDQYGVLDGEGSTGTCGFTSYEIKNENRPKVVAAFHNYFKKIYGSIGEVKQFATEAEMLSGFEDSK